VQLVLRNRGGELSAENERGHAVGVGRRLRWNLGALDLRSLGRRGQLWVDILGTLIFLLPTCIILAWLSWPFFMQSFLVDEHSSNAGGLLRWPIKLVLPVGFLLVALQGLSELIKRVAFLNGIPVESLEAHYERPTQ